MYFEIYIHVFVVGSQVVGIDESHWQVPDVHAKFGVEIQSMIGDVAEHVAWSRPTKMKMNKQLNILQIQVYPGSL